MVSFSCDYLEGAHSKVLERLLAANDEQTPGYGEDQYCCQAAALIRELCAAPKAEVHFLVGGTQANSTVIDAALRTYQGVLSAHTGHINVHESGAIEAAGHKVLALPGTDGKITAQQVRDYVREHRTNEAREHMVQPALVYISHPTELGALYSKAELRELYAACQELGLRLFLDGARLAYALAAESNDLSLADIALFSDVFYIGGTKCGALFGEAVVITDPDLQRDFRYIQKQHGAILAKGRLLGLQYLALLEDGLYYRLGEHGDRLAARIAGVCSECGLELLSPPVTNQLFPIFGRDQLDKLEAEFEFSDHLTLPDGRVSARIVASWATRDENVERLIAALRGLKK